MFPKSNLLNPFKFLWCYLIAGHDWRNGGDWFICARCNHLFKSSVHAWKGRQHGD